METEEEKDQNTSPPEDGAKDCKEEERLQEPDKEKIQPEKEEQGSILDQYNPEQYQRKKEQNRRERGDGEYHNCFFIDGKELNHFIFNSGEINGSINQGSGQTVEEGEAPFQFRDQKDMKELIKRYVLTDYVPIFLTITVLKMVPVSHLVDVSQVLKTHLYTKKEAGEQPEVKGNALQSMEELLEFLNAEIVLATMESEAGRLEFQSVIFKNPSIIPELNKELWTGYPGMRKGLIDWLLDISRLRPVRKLILCQIGEAIAEFASMDFAYAQNNIIPRFVKSHNRDNFYFLLKIMERCLEEEAYRENAEKLLCHWAELDNNQVLWQIAFCLYDSDKNYGFHSQVRSRLQTIIRAELASGLEVELEQVVYFFKDDSELPFDLLQEKEDMAQLYIEVLSGQFELCEKKRDRLRFGYYFMTLMWQDYIEEGYPLYRSLFLNSFNSRESRKRLGPLMRYVWQKQILRQLFLEKILLLYIKELRDLNRPWDYMKNFLKVIAFTGEETDFEHTLRTLGRIKTEQEGKAIADQMKEYLVGLLSSRR
ncbi:hypothetical protein [Lacrimispora indolis]|uniref:hypothetical protein n=1 Tax=Lacrimispora indolis TaxID=69825 RepID=UPI00045E9F6E|nr:hypothetical protein [Lacrimispora indolis]